MTLPAINPQASLVQRQSEGAYIDALESYPDLHRAALMRKTALSCCIVCTSLCFWPANRIDEKCIDKLWCKSTYQEAKNYAGEPLRDRCHFWTKTYFQTPCSKGDMCDYKVDLLKSPANYPHMEFLYPGEGALMKDYYARLQAKPPFQPPMS